jgi:hypothetical protein
MAGCFPHNRKSAAVFPNDGVSVNREEMHWQQVSRALDFPQPSQYVPFPRHPALLQSYKREGASSATFFSFPSMPMLYFLNGTQMGRFPLTLDPHVGHLSFARVSSTNSPRLSTQKNVPFQSKKTPVF